MRDPDLEDLVTTVHLVGSGLKARGLRPAAARAPCSGSTAARIRSTGSTGTSGCVLAVRPDGRGQERDNAEELELKAKLEKELPIEQDLTRWFAFFDAPL